jgi:hypothetical protein
VMVAAVADTRAPTTNRYDAPTSSVIINVITVITTKSSIIVKPLQCADILRRMAELPVNERL